MAISEHELKNLVSVKAGVEKITTLSSDGRNLLTRVPKEIREFLDLKKGHKVRWFVDIDKKIKMEIIQ
jgi:bifunctional DNA-binding transcriptional regulator/antitoxin component of YhaV-PrlF toxin-antitoxin module